MSEDLTKPGEQDGPPRPVDGIEGFCAAVFACATFGVVEALVACLITGVLALFEATSVMPIGDLIIFAAMLAYWIVIVSFFASLITSLVFFTLVGFPVHFLLVWRKARSLRAYLIAGFFANAAVTVGLMFVPCFRSAFFHLRMFTIPDFAIGGPLAQGVFWWVVRPDRRAHGKST